MSAAYEVGQVYISPSKKRWTVIGVQDSPRLISVRSDNGARRTMYAYEMFRWILEVTE